MRHWQQYNSIEQIQILDIASGKTGFPRIAVEKDWWITMVLKVLSMTQYAHLMSFKGGTSLSKGWQLIDRFSEDIDIAIKRKERFTIFGTSNTQIAKARRAARHYIIRELPDELSKALISLEINGFKVEPEISMTKKGEIIELRADTHPSVIYVNYSSVIPETSNYVEQKVKIEFSCLSMEEPVEELRFSSFISASVESAEDMDIRFNTVIPTRTFLEKIFLLHEEFQKEIPRSYRMSRHLYDLEKIMDNDFGNAALADTKLYSDIVKHRSIYNKLPNVDYSTHQQHLIRFLPPESVMKEWKNDYENMKKNFIYDSQILSFEKLIERISELQERINNLYPEP